MKKIFAVLMIALATSLTFISCQEEEEPTTTNNNNNNTTVETVSSPSSIVGKRLILSDDTWVKYNFGSNNHLSIQHETMTVNGSPSYVYQKTGAKTADIQLTYSLSDFLGATNYIANYTFIFVTNNTGTYTGSVAYEIPDNDSGTYEVEGTFRFI